MGGKEEACCVTRGPRERYFHSKFHNPVENHRYLWKTCVLSVVSHLSFLYFSLLAPKARDDCSD